METEEVVMLARLREMCANGTARKIRVTSGVALSEVAAAVGVSWPCIWKWENGHRVPRDERALLYADLLRRLRATRGRATR